MPTIWKSPCYIQRLLKPEEKVAKRSCPEILKGYYWVIQQQTEKPKLSPEEIRWLNNAFSFDYMGSAEFEFGAFPKAMKRLALCFGANKVEASQITWQGHTFWLFCLQEHIAEAKKFIQDELEEKGNHRLKEVTYMQPRYFGGKVKQTVTTVGWVDIENLWVLSMDLRQMENIAMLCGVEFLVKSMQFRLLV